MGHSSLLMKPDRLHVSGCRRAVRSECKFNPAAESAGSVLMGSSVLILALVICQPSGLLAQTALQPEKTATNSVGLPKPTVNLIAGTWKYRATATQADGTAISTYSITIKDDRGVWTVTYTAESSVRVTDVSTLEKSTLILRKESFKHFAKPGRPWLITTNLDFTNNKVIGTTNISGQNKPVAIDLGGPLFAYSASPVTIGCLPLADGYSTIFQNFDIQKLKEKLLQLKVEGMERVTVPAGTFDSYKVELTSADNGSYKQTVWIAKDSRTPVKVSEVLGNIGGSMFTSELIPF